MDKYPDKKICMRILYKDYNVSTEDREAYKKAYDFLKEKKDAICVGKTEEVPVGEPSGDSPEVVG
jgi:hypothetical protein